MCANPCDEIFKVASVASLFATNISFRYVAEYDIGATSPLHVQSTSMLILFVLMFEYPNTILPLLSLQVNVKLFSSCRAPFALINVDIKFESNLISALKSGNCFKSGTLGITDKSANI